MNDTPALYIPERDIWLGLGWPQPTFALICAPCMQAFQSGNCPNCGQPATHERRPRDPRKVGPISSPSEDY